MIDLLLLIFFCTIFAYVIQSRTFEYTCTRAGIKKDRQSKVIYIGIFVAFILFAGLRSSYNDTQTYMHAYSLCEVNNIKISTLFEPYGGYDLYQQLLKKYISENPQVFIFVTAIITNSLFLSFYVRHTRRYCDSIFLYSIGIYIFSMAGLKQAIAMGISLYAIDSYLKHKYIKALALLFLATTFHPYIICIICIPLLKEKVWDIKTVSIILVCIIAFANLESVLGLFSIIGKDYSDQGFDSYTINPIRVLVESIPVVISLIYRKKINKSRNSVLILGINMKIISFIFIAMGLFMNPIYLGRMASYFTVLTSVAIPDMLAICWKKERNGEVLIKAYYIFFLIYFLMDLTKIGSINLLTDQFNHVSIIDLLK